MLAAHVVEVNVNPVRGGIAQQLGDGSGAVVERGIEAEVGEKLGHLRVRAGAPYHAVPAGLGDLGGEPADRARGRRDPDDVTVPQLRGLEQTGPGGQADTAKGAEVGLRWRGRDVEAPKGAEAAQGRLTSTRTTA